MLTIIVELQMRLKAVFVADITVYALLYESPEKTDKLQHRESLAIVK